MSYNLQDKETVSEIYKVPINHLVAVTWIRNSGGALRFRTPDGTGIMWGSHWRTGDEGYIHVKDAAFAIVRGIVREKSKEQFNKALSDWQNNRAILPENAQSRNQEVIDVNDLTSLPNIGDGTAKMLKEADYTTIHDIAGMSAEELTQYGVHMTEARAQEAIRVAKVMSEKAKLS